MCAREKVRKEKRKKLVGTSDCNEVRTSERSACGQALSKSERNAFPQQASTATRFYKRLHTHTHTQDTKCCWRSSCGLVLVTREVLLAGVSNAGGQTRMVLRTPSHNHIRANGRAPRRMVSCCFHRKTSTNLRPRMRQRGRCRCSGKR